MTAAELKASILDLAVRGLLVPQDPKDKPAAKPSDIDDPPYELPRNWVWKRLGELGSTINGLWKGVKKPFINVAVIRAANFTRDCELKLENIVNIDVETAKYEKRKLLPGDIIIERSGGGENQPVGRAALFDRTEGEFSFCNFTSVLRVENKAAVFPRFLQQVLTALYATGYTAKIQSNTTGLRNLDFKAYLEIPIPLPPLPEQKRIVAKIEELMPLVEEYGAAQKELEALNADFPAALRESILQDAVQGKLTAEWRKSHRGESAADLLAQIAAEKKRLLATKKIKKEKPLPPITDDEKPFEIPDIWAWCRLGEICSKVGAGATPKGGSNVYVSRGVKLLREQNVHDDGLHLDNVVFITKEANDAKPGSQVRARDILVNITGASIGRNALVPDDFDVANVNQHVLIVRLVDLSLRHYMHESLRSSAVLNQMFDKQTGDKPGLSAEKVKAFLIPLPPLAEQKAIVERVDELLKIVDAMKAQ